MNTTERNKATILQMLDEVAKKGIVSQVEYFADEVNNHGEPVNRQAIREVLEDILLTFPDASFELADVVAEGDRVVVRCFLKGTHEGMALHPYVHEGLLAGVPPTKRSVRVQHIHIFRLEDGRIVEHWAGRDDVAMVRQLGLADAVGPVVEERS